jgi:hypothetical protein
MNKEEIESLQLSGGYEPANPYILDMIKFYQLQKGNLYKFLLDLPKSKLKKLLNYENDESRKIRVSMSIIAYIIEKGQYGNQFSVDVEKLILNSNAFYDACVLSFLEKLGKIKCIHDCYFWAPDQDFTIKVFCKDELSDLVKEIKNGKY